MVYQKFYETCEHFFGWRYIACGEIVDRMILENRGDFGRSMMISRRGVWRKKRDGKR